MAVRRRGLFGDVEEPTRENDPLAGLDLAQPSGPDGGGPWIDFPQPPGNEPTDTSPPTPPPDTTTPPPPPPPPAFTPKPLGAAPLGYDPTKWADLTHTSNKYVAGRMIAQGYSAADVAAKLGGTLVGKDKVQFPDGSVYDFIGDEEGAHIPFWYPVQGPGGTPYVEPGATGTAGDQMGIGARPGVEQPTSITSDSVVQALTALGKLYGGPGNAGVYEGTDVQQVGQDPLSQAATGGLIGLLNALAGPSEAEQMLLELGGQAGTPNPDLINRKMESVREAAERVRKSEKSTLLAQLADRNLISVPGAPQGIELSSLERLSNDIAASQFGSLRDIATAEMERSGAQGLQALQSAAAAGSTRAQNILGTLREITSRQNTLSQIALQSLAQNTSWNEFLATLGLNRDQVMNELQRGNIETVLPVLQAFLQIAQLSSAGHI